MIDEIKKIQKEAYRSILAEYAAGNLNEIMNMFISSHATLSPSARKYINHCEEIAGNMLENIEINKNNCHETMSMNSLLNTLHAIENQNTTRKKLQKKGSGKLP